MTAQLRIFPETATNVLAVVPPQFEERLLHRAVEAAEMLGADLRVYCPVTRMVAPHTAVTPDLSTAAAERKIDRERATQVTGQVQRFLNENEIEAYVEVGINPSLTDGILNEAARLKPDLLILPFIRPDSAVPLHELIRYETVWSRLQIPVWIVNSECPGENGVAGYVATEKRRNRDDNEDARVSAAVARFASRLGSDAHLMCCLKPPAALEIAKEVMAPPAKGIAEVADDSMARDLHELAESYEIPKEQVHVYRGPASYMIDNLVEPLRLGLVITSGQSRSLLDRLSRRWPAEELLDQRCDVLVLGKPGARIDVARA